MKIKDATKTKEKIVVKTAKLEKPVRRTTDPVLFMRAKKEYKMMDLAIELNVSRQYANYMLNEGVKMGILKRTGLRKWYIYTKSKTNKEVLDIRQKYKLKMSKLKAKTKSLS